MNDNEEHLLMTWINNINTAITKQTESHKDLLELCLSIDQRLKYVEKCVHDMKYRE